MHKYDTLAMSDVSKIHNNFNVIRLFLAAAVIFGHAWPIVGTKSDPTARFFLPQDHYIGTVAVDIFFKNQVN